MSYSLLEASVQSGSPLELYHFSLGDVAYRFTSAADALEYEGHTYDPVPIVRDQVSVGSDDRTNVLTMTMPSSHEFTNSYARRVPGKRAVMTIRRVHRQDGDAQLITLFKGVVRSISFSDKNGTATIALMPISGALARAVPRYLYQSLCNHVLFDSWCQVNQASWAYEGTVDTVTSNTVFEVNGLGAAKGSDWAKGGFLMYDLDYRLIIGQTGSQVKLVLPFNTDLTGETVEVFAGCDHTLTTCRDKFENAINHGGFPFVPLRNPFQSGIK